MNRRLKWILATIAIVIFGLALYFYIAFLPIMTGMGAKTMCSCVYVMGRDPESVKLEEMSVFPGLSTAAFNIDNNDSSVTTTKWGRSSKAIFRKGLGCTLLAERTEQAIRQQPIHLAGPPPFSQDTVLWPLGDKRSDSALGNVDYNKVRDAVDSAFIDVNPSKPVYTHAVVVVYKGQIIGEKYAEGFSAKSRMMGWSMTKSITNALIGLLIKDGKLKLEAPAPVPEWNNDERNTITLNDLLHASSGLEWSETYFLPGDFHNMFIFSDDKGGYAAGKEVKYAPNTYFEYSSGTANLLSRIVRQSVGDTEYYRFPYERLFYKTGMFHALLEPDASGTFVGSSYGYATARDWARFGLLFLNDGVVNGERILPEGWVKYSATPAPAAPRQEYGAHWWLNAGEKSNPENCKYPGLPHDAMVADGFEHQHVVVIPSKELVIVRLGVTHNGNFSLSKLVNGVIGALK